MFSYFKNWFANKTFSKKILFSYLLFCFIPLILTAVICYFIFFNALYTSTKSSITDSNDKISVLLTNKLKQYETIVNNIICDPAFICIVQDPNGIMTAYEVNQYLDERLSELRVSIPELEDFTIYANSVYENDFFQPLSEIGNNRNISYASKQQVSTWYSENGEVYAAYPIYGLYKNNLLGVITMHFDMEQLVNTFTQISRDEYGVYIYGPTSEKLYNSENFTFEIGKITERMLQSQNQRLFAAGRNFIVEYSQVQSYKISIYCIVPEQSILKPIRNYFFILAIVWICCLFLVLVLCSFLSRSLGKRVRLLESQMTQVAKGDFTVFEPEVTLDEIGNISRFCSQTLSKLNILINDNYLSQIRLQDAKNKALVAQINPHFLYNTLNMIAGQAIITENHIISDVVMQLSDYYRTTLNKGKNLILIRDEIRNVSAYCNLQLRLHDYRFRVEYDIDPSVLDYCTINLCLQPLAENAIEHGVSGLEDNGFIKISAKPQDGDIVFTVINNGAPEILFNPNDLINMTTKGYGLKNVQSRIKILFGEEYGLTLSCKNSCFYAVVKIPATFLKDDETE